MKPPKSEPYQRSRQRAALHAWVVAATAVASIGMGAPARAVGNEDRSPGVHDNEQRADQAAQRTAGDWLEALRQGDHDKALLSMRLPREPEHEHDVLDELAALSDWLQQSGAVIEPVAHRRAGHWALSAWRLDAPETVQDEAGLIEPITLYNPAGDGLIEASSAWQVVPQGFETDAALAPLYNADHDQLVDWFETLS